MTNITHSISVDIQKHAKRQVVYMKQGDAMSRELTISFYNDGAVWALPNDVTVLQLAYCKEDFVGGCYDHMPDNTAAFTINTGRTSATMKIHPQVLIVAGNVICELRLLNASAHVLNTFNFVINVEKSPIAMTSSSEGYYNNVFDGATFTPHVSDAGILSWTNNKNLPNPDPIDLKEFVVDPGDMPVTTMEIVTSEDAEENADADDKLATPAAAQALIDRLLPVPIQLTLMSGFKYDALKWDQTKSYAANDYFFLSLAGTAAAIGFPHLYKCVNAFSGGQTLETRINNGDVTDLGPIFTLPSGFTNVRHLRAAMKKYCCKILFGTSCLHQLQYSEASKILNCSNTLSGMNRTVTIRFDANDDITQVLYLVSPL